MPLGVRPVLRGVAPPAVRGDGGTAVPAAWLPSADCHAPEAMPPGVSAPLIVARERGGGPKSQGMDQDTFG